MKQKYTIVMFKNGMQTKTITTFDYYMHNWSYNHRVIILQSKLEIAVKQYLYLKDLECDNMM